ATTDRIVAADRVPEQADPVDKRQLRSAWEALVPEKCESALRLARGQAGILGSVGVDVAPVYAFLDAVEGPALDRARK
ncbi:MAG: hypothetical protein AAGG01_20095, partial [Planctomycetota bacterium]